MSIPERIYIVGFMGSGKTTAGRKLAKLLEWKFIDLDDEIERLQGMSIPKIFAELGEGHFREVESDALRRVSNLDNVVISTGGGAPCYNENMDLMLSTGLTVYLKMTPIQLTSRLVASDTERPLLKGIPEEKLPEFIASRLSEREKFYNRSELTLDGKDPDLHILKNLLTGL